MSILSHFLDLAIAKVVYRGIWAGGWPSTIHSPDDGLGPWEVEDAERRQAGVNCTVPSKRSSNLGRLTSGSRFCVYALQCSLDYEPFALQGSQDFIVPEYILLARDVTALVACSSMLPPERMSELKLSEVVMDELAKRVQGLCIRLPCCLRLQSISRICGIYPL